MVHTVVSIISLVSITCLFFFLGRFPFKKIENQVTLFAVSIFGITVSLLFWVLINDMPHVFEWVFYFGGIIFSYMYGQNRKYNLGSVIWRKKSLGLITVEEYKANNLLIIKRNNRILSGINMLTLEPTTKLFWYLHLAELFPSVPQRILVLGGGACAYPINAMNTNSHLTIDVVEIDPVVVEAATRFFPLPNTEKFRLMTDDGIHHLKRLKASSHDLIFVDVGLTLVNHQKTFNTQFIDSSLLKEYRRVLGDNGTLIINVITTRTSQDLLTVARVFRKYAKSFDSHFIFKVTPKADDNNIQDMLYVFSKQKITIQQLKRRLINIPSDMLSYSKDRYRYMFSTELT